MVAPLLRSGQFLQKGIKPVLDQVNSDCNCYSRAMRSPVKLSSRLTALSDEQIHQMVEIVVNYFPAPDLMEQTIRNHQQEAGTIRLALQQGKTVGFSIASRYTMKTPFYPRRTNVIYQRMLFLQPGLLYRGIGIKLLAATMKDLFGWFWPFRRFVAICRTQNPVVAKIMSLYSVSYPRYNQPLPDEVRQFEESLLPMLGGEKLDEQSRLIGTLDTFKEVDYTDIWNKFLHRRNNEFESLMLHSAFEKRGDRIINSGASVLMLGYAKPLTFVRYIVH